MDATAVDVDNPTRAGAIELQDRRPLRPSLERERHRLRTAETSRASSSGMHGLPMKPSAPASSSTRSTLAVSCGVICAQPAGLVAKRFYYEHFTLSAG